MKQSINHCRRLVNLFIATMVFVGLARADAPFSTIQESGGTFISGTCIANGMANMAISMNTFFIFVWF